MINPVPALAFVGADPVRLPSLGRVLRDPLACWPPSVLDRPLTEGRSGTRRVALLAEPRAVGEILLNRAGRFPRCRLHEKILGAAYGEELAREDNPDWRRQRREVAQPMSSERAQALVPRIQLALDRSLAQWEARPEREPLDVLFESRRLTLDVLWSAFFCDDEAARAREPLVEEAANALDRRPDLLDQLNDLEPLAAEAVRRQAFRRADIGAGEEVGIETIRLFLHVGHDNSAAALSWALWLLALHPEWQERARAEWQDADALTPVDNAACPVTSAVLRETLRLFPPILQLSREVESEVEVAGERPAPGWTAIVNLYVLHRNRLLWPEPDSFDPSRFLEAGDEIRRRLLWLPFGTGPRGCIGAMFAQIELTLALGRILSRFQLLPNPDEGLACRVDWALRPEGRRPLFIRRLD
jgi:cytochrome P450